ncbi:MAG: LysM peptidoglycan-binding domain-containing protein [Candidatus Amulumruptor caecigallinarius]|nr:LysM peptidoglycan-binding domain-containing protein [Candidatus Amulumruptor caecigallinarius]
MSRIQNVIICSALSASAVAVPLIAADVNLPIVEILGSKYYLYEAKKGDTLFGIAREFNWDDATLQKLNPSSVSPLKKGVKIYYPVPDAVQKNASYAVNATDEVAHRADVISHVVRHGETIYSIAKLYNVKVEDLYRLNPNSRNGVSSGEILKITSDNNSDASNGYYTIKKGDTLYKVANKFNTTVAAVMQANPGVSERNFKAGDVIKIPPRGTGVVKEQVVVRDTTVNGFMLHKVEPDETLRSIARKNDLDVEQLKDVNPGVESVKKNQVIAIPKLETTEKSVEEVTVDPRELSREGRLEIYDSVHNIAASDIDLPYVVKVGVVTENSSAKRDLEFVRGFITGIDRLKNEDYKIELKVIDGSEQPAQIIATLEDYNPVVVFSTNDKELPAYLAKYASDNRTYVVNTFDIKSDAYNDNAYIIQTLAPSQYFNDSETAYIKAANEGYELILTGVPDENDQLASSLRKIWPASKVTSVDVSYLPNMPISDNGKYIFYGYSVKKQEISDLLNAVGNIIMEHPLAEIVTLGRPNWILYDEALKQELHKSNTVIPSRFYINKDSADTKRFEEGYKNLFKREPYRSVPLYSALGYDCSMYFLPQLGKSRGDMNALRPSVECVQNEFDLARTSNWGGLINQPSYLVNYTTFGTVEKIVVK